MGEILSAEEVAKRRSMHICASSRPMGCEYCEALDCIDALRRERDEAHGGLDEALHALGMEYANWENEQWAHRALRAEVTRLREALGRYGKHDADHSRGAPCPARHYTQTPRQPCTCGLDAALGEQTPPEATFTKQQMLDAVRFATGVDPVDALVGEAVRRALSAPKEDRCPTCGSDNPNVRGWDAEHQRHNRPIMDQDCIRCPLHGDVGHSRVHGRCTDPWHGGTDDQ